MKAMLSTVAMSLLFVTGAASAQSGAEVVKAKGCLNCHDMDAKKVGPSFKEIATKHRGNKEAGDKLVAALRDGKGHMKVAASDAEIKAAVQYVLALK
jgi:cytochrome c